jgi:ATP-dependent protease ClpP protease subunit
MFEIRAQANNEVEVLMYGTIAQWEKVNASDFVAAVDSALRSNPKTIIFPIHSPGGDVGEGMPMINKVRELKRKGVKTIARVDGMAASMASVFSSACDETEVTPFCRMMVHEGKVGVYGSVNQLRNKANLLEGINKDIASVYSEKTGKEDKWILQNWMPEGKDTWFTAQEAIDAKLADRKIGVVVKNLPKISALGDWTAMAAAYDPFFNDTTHKLMNREEIIKMLGLQANATDAEILAAVGTLHAKATEKKDAPSVDAAAAAAKTSQDVTPLLDGIVALAKERGLSDAQIESVKVLAKTDMKAAMAFIPAKSEEKKDEAETKTLSITDLIAAAMKGDGGSKAPSNRDWNEWQKHPDEFAVLLDKNPKEYIKVFKAEFGYEPTEGELKGLRF